jgi:hypothetical protein
MTRQVTNRPEGRVPVSVIRTDFFATYFDQNGGMDERKPRVESVIDASRYSRR